MIKVVELIEIVIHSYLLHEFYHPKRVENNTSVFQSHFSDAFVNNLSRGQINRSVDIFQQIKLWKEYIWIVAYHYVFELYIGITFDIQHLTVNY